MNRTNIASTRNGALRSMIVASILALSVGSALAQTAFDAPDVDYGGRVRASGAAQGLPVYSGGGVKLSGQGFKPGQEITIARGVTPLLPGAVVADQEGKFSASFTLPADAAIGTHPLVVSTQKPYNAEILDLKISPQIPLSGADKFTLADTQPAKGLYQSAYSAKNSALFVTASSGRPPEVTSELLKLDPQTLAVVSKITPAPAPGRDGAPGGVFAVYGVGVDDVNDTVWVTNTRQNTVAVYKQSDLSLVKQFEPGTVQHARDAVADARSGKVFVSATGTPVVAVFDARTQAFSRNIEIESSLRGKDFSVGSLQLDSDKGKLYAVSLTTGEAAIVDIASDTVEKVFPVQGARTAIGVAYGAATNRLFVAGQGSDNLLIVDAETGTTLHDVKVGAGALNVAFEPVGKLIYVASRDAGTVTVVDLDGNIVANLENSTANHVAADGKGNIFAINKGRGPDDAKGDRVTRITARQ